MKRIIATAGLAALGASSLQAQYTQGLVPADQSKPWWVGLTVRGFYDSNYLTQYGGDDKDSWGISVTPSVGINFNLENTLISASYVFDLRWFEAPESGNSQYSQIANLALSHAFSERVSVDVTERFIAAQEGTIVVDGPIAAPGNNGMTDSDYLRNTVGASVDWSMTEKVGLTFS